MQALPKRFSIISQWQNERRLAGRSSRTASEHVRILRSLPTDIETITKPEARLWQSEAATPATQRQRARALNAVLAFMEAEGLRDDCEWRLNAPTQFDYVDPGGAAPFPRCC
jgi:hypothetical protein